MNYLKLTQEKLEVDQITELVTSPDCGAISIFVGTTRDNFDGKNVIELEYEAYEPMALKVMEELCNEIRQKWNQIKNIAIYHRLGSVLVKESSIIIAISSPHRLDAMLATQYCIDTFKSKVPVWKKEVYGNGEAAEWKENKECSWSRKI